VGLPKDPEVFPTGSRMFFLKFFMTMATNLSPSLPTICICSSLRPFFQRPPETGPLFIELLCPQRPLISWEIRAVSVGRRRGRHPPKHHSIRLIAVATLDVLPSRPQSGADRKTGLQKSRLSPGGYRSYFRMETPGSWIQGKGPTLGELTGDCARLPY